MLFTFKQIEPEDYDNLLVGWWKDWGWEPPQRDFLPGNGCGGLIVFDGDVPVCAGFMYATNSSVAWVDWIISNKNYREKPGRQEAIKGLIDLLTDTARSSGFKYVYALIKHTNLIETYESLGYVKGNSYVGELIKAL